MPAETALDPLARLPHEWEAALAEIGEPRYRGKQIFTWIWQRGVTDPNAMTDVPKSLRAALIESGLGLPLETSTIHASADATRKLAVKLRDDREIETVLIPQLEAADPDRDDDASEGERVPGNRVTQCISSQVGCAMGCVFCASGVAGLKRHLSAAEIAGQVLLGKQHLREGEAIRNVVYMGMGEPLHNYDAVARSLKLLTHPDGLGLSKRRVTVSTSGLVPEIDRLGKDFGGDVQLAISIHAPSDSTRSEIMPINRRYPLRDLMAALARYPLPRRRRFTIEYTLIRNVNDSLKDADALVRLLRPIRAKVNLIPMNPVSDSPLESPDDERVSAFQERIAGKGLSCFIRTQRGDPIAAACGQLALAGEKAKVRRPLPTFRD
jgi:23S rRNA (adenine2503-C2)-methyltransferase